MNPPKKHVIRKKLVKIETVENHHYNKTKDPSLRIRFMREDELTTQNKQDIDLLLKECFSHVDPMEVEECFYALSFLRILAYLTDTLVGHLRLFKRSLQFERQEVLVGGIGGVCVLPDHRGRGIASSMVKEGLQLLRSEKVDVACLNADLSLDGEKFYERLGFKLMNRRISFEDVHGKIRYDTGTMFIPVCSNRVYENIMRSGETFHYGKGYW